MSKNRQSSKTPKDEGERIKNPPRVRTGSPHASPPSPKGRGGKRTDKPSLPIPSLLQIVVECRSEDQQQDLFERLRQEGYSCRVLTL